MTNEELQAAANAQWQRAAEHNALAAAAGNDKAARDYHKDKAAQAETAARAYEAAKR